MKNNYATLTTLQLAGEDSFIRWVLNGEDAAEWNSLITQNPELRSKSEEARHIVLALTNTEVQTIPVSDANQLWKKIESSIKSPKENPKTINLTLLWKWGFTAAASLAFVVWFNYVNHTDNVFAQTGEKKEINLTDESIVTLNAGSYLSYKDRKFKEDRVLNLEGEAFFKVKPGSTFTVKTQFGSVTVLGTSFNVVAREGLFEVNCYTGKVKVETSNHKQEMVITAGERSIDNKSDQTLLRSTFMPSEAGPEWMSGKFAFENQPLSRVISELERQYGIQVKLEKGLENKTYTGLFESGDLNKALYRITWPLHLKSTVSGKTVIISS